MEREQLLLQYLDRLIEVHTRCYPVPEHVFKGVCNQLSKDLSISLREDSEVHTGSVDCAPSMTLLNNK